MNNYQKYSFVLAGILSSKTSNMPVLADDLRIKKLHVLAGPYKPSKFYLAHSLVFNSVVGQFPLFSYRRHGKREKETVAMFADYRSYNQIYGFIGRFINLIMPSIIDMRSIRGIKRARFSSTLMCRLRYRFGVNFPDCDELITDEMHDTKRGVFLPLYIAVVFGREMGYLQVENLARMLRLPISFFRWWPYPAVDDAEVYDKYNDQEDYY
jgi:hypothetical protein